MRLPLKPVRDGPVPIVRNRERSSAGDAGGLNENLRRRRLSQVSEDAIAATQHTVVGKECWAWVSDRPIQFLRWGRDGILRSTALFA